MNRISIALSGCLAMLAVSCASAPPRPNPAFIRFNVGEAAPLPVDTNLVQYAADTLNANPKLQALAIGHADSTGDAAANRELSLRRARAVRALIVAKGIDQKRIQVAAHGEGAPVVSNDTEEGRQINRRVQVFFYDPAAGQAQQQYGSTPLDIRAE